MPVVDYEPKVEGKVKRIEESDDLNDRDRKVLLDYRRDLILQDLSLGRIYKVLSHIRKLVERLGGKSLVEAT